MDEKQIEIDGQLDGTISGTILDTAKYVGTSIFSFIFEKYLDIVNSFLSKVQAQVSELLPAGSPVMDRYKQSQLITQAINEAFNDPVFKAQIQAFGQNIKEAIEPFLVEINQLLVEGALTLFPGVGTVIDLLNVLQGVLDSASVVSVEFFKNMSKFMEAFLNVFGETSGPVVRTIQSIDELFKSIQQIQERVNTQIANVKSMTDVKSVTPSAGGKKTIKRRKRKSILKRNK